MTRRGRDGGMMYVAYSFLFSPWNRYLYRYLDIDGTGLTFYLARPDGL